MDERSLSEATEGRVAQDARALLEACWGRPTGGPELARGLRSSRLWSRQRRLMRELVYATVRGAGAHHRDLRAGGWEGAEPVWAAWLAELVTRGLDPRRAGELLGEPVFGHRAPPPKGWSELAEHGGLSEALLRRLGDLELASEMVLGQMQRAPLCLRSTERDGLLDQLESAGIQARPSRWSRDGLVLQGHPDLSPWKGRFQLQDEASQLVAELVAPPRRSLVIDLCAGAGGKSLALAARAPKGCRVLASDVRPRALKEARRRARELGLGLKTVRPEQLEPASAARVLVDAPCSGSGTLRRDPALRWRLDETWLEDKLSLQVRILDRAAQLVKPGGRLIYATCSMLPEESQLQLAAFLERHPDWEQMDALQLLGGARRELLQDGCLVTSPARHGLDGFFAAVVLRPS